MDDDASGISTTLLHVTWYFKNWSRLLAHTTHTIVRIDWHLNSELLITQQRVCKLSSKDTDGILTGYITVFPLTTGKHSDIWLRCYFRQPYYQRWYSQLIEIINAYLSGFHFRINQMKISTHNIFDKLYLICGGYLLEKNPDEMAGRLSDLSIPYILLLW